MNSLNPPEQNTILKSWVGQSSVEVQILCAAYNHAKYIRQTLDGFLAQKTKFKFEIIVRDDASSDATRSIISEYKDKYPDIIKTIFYSENQFRKNGTSPLYDILRHADAKYVAICEGDDYWVDENKLQKQFEVMESNPGIAFCCHRVHVLYETVVGTPYRPYGDAKIGRFVFQDALKAHFIPTLSLFCRNEYIPRELPDFFYKILSRDIFIELSMLTKGDGFYIDDVLGVYRHHDGGLTKQPTSVEETRQRELLLYEGLKNCLPTKYSSMLHKKIPEINYTAFRKAMARGEIILSLRYACLAIARDPFVILKMGFRALQRKMH